MNPLPFPSCPYLELIANGSISLVAVSSEPLEELSLDIPAMQISNLAPSVTPANGMDWEFEIPFYPFQLLGLNAINFYFTGSDLSGNALLDLTPSTPFVGCVVLPVRLENGWSSTNIPTGADGTHYFALGCGGNRPAKGSNEETILSIIPDPNCIEINYMVIPASGPWIADGEIILEPPMGGVPPYTYEWDNGETTSSISGLLPGEYCVIVNDALCCEKEVCIVVGDNCELAVNPTPVCVCTPGGYGSVELEITNGNGSYGYQWAGPNNFNSVDYPIEIPEAGTYLVTVTDLFNGCTASAEVTVTACNFDITNFNIETNHACS